MVISKVSPAVTTALEDNEPTHRQFPAVVSSHIDQCEYVSDAATFVHVNAVLEAFEPPDAALQLTALRVASVAAFAVPSSPGSPVCSLT